MNKKNIFIIVIMLILSAGLLSAQAEVKLETLLAEAEAAFQQGNELLQTDPEMAEQSYRTALKYYNSIIDSGMSNAGLYYNIGNTYFRLNDLGYAILSYRRALLYTPNDNQIQSNLEYARSLQKNGFSVTAENEILQILFFWHYIIPFLWKIIIIISANFILWSSLILLRFGRRSWRAAIISSTIILIIGGSIYIDQISSRIQHGVVTAESTIGRLGDSKSYEPAFDVPLYQGVEFVVEQSRVGWLLVELSDSEKVWLEAADCTIIEELP